MILIIVLILILAIIGIVFAAYCCIRKKIRKTSQELFIILRRLQANPMLLNKIFLYLD